MIAVGTSAASFGSFWSRKARSPTFSRPIELSIPEGVSNMRCGGLPARGLSVTVLVTMPPSVASA